MRIVPRACVAAVAACALVPSASAACLQVGVYQDDPVRSLAALERSVGPGVRTISTYLTAGRPLDPTLIQFANKRRAGLMISWLPDSGRDGPKQPAYRLAAITKGKYDTSLRTLARQLKGLKRPAVFRPMPEPNTPWYAWSGTVNGNKPSQYLAAWRHVRKVIRSAGARNVKFLWTPYARSVPDTGANAINAYFPGKAQVDLVGAVAYNFGQKSGLTWAEPGGLFATAYSTIEALAAKPFWIAETGSTARGGDKAAWIRALPGLTSTMPKLAGVVWFDVKDGNGDFRLTGKTTTSAFKTLLKRSCR